MRVFLALLAILFGVGLQASPLNSLLPIRLDPLLALTVSWGVAAGPLKGTLFGFGAGAAADLLIGGGSMTVTHLLMGALSGALKPLLFYRQAIILLPLVALATALQEALVTVILFLTGHGMHWLHWGAIAGPEALGNMILAWPFYVGVKAVVRITEPRIGSRTEGLA